MTKYAEIAGNTGFPTVTSWLVCSRRMGQTAATPHSLATASGLLLGTTGVCMALGALIGWAAGSAGVGLLVGAIVGIPAAIAVVYKVYSGGEA